ncbi:S24 family peptidase [Sphingomonas donggukensis]|uniref:S24 family peptidase n=1 Tax=Sphingomonas donggukensis TaxID=2949093 RepID=A0ABY4TUX2_9SPHN|nr:S24 family peptidase [Sphingomonas donggukensis]URW75511.1 S24 family peptidase [Sphingomonas donggukensis]
MDEAAQRTALSALIARDGVSLATLSRVAGRNAAWMQQYLRRGTPRLLPERERGALARFFGVADAALGGPVEPALVQVPRLAIRVSAGPGRFVTDERAVAGAGYARADLDRLGVAPANAAIFEVSGDSMWPTLHDGDRILVDRARRAGGGARAIWVIRTGDTLHVKRLLADGDAWRIVSDNAAEETRGRGEVEVLGRVMQLVRAL